MGAFYFGREEKVTCVVDVEVLGQHDEPLCLAYKTSVFYVGGGTYLRDDGYVLRPRGQPKVFYHLTQDEIHLYQAEGGLPTPLPVYSIPLADYVWGYSLWIVMAAGILWTILATKWRARKERRVLEGLQEALGNEPPREDGPRVRTDTDHFICASVKPLLRPGERLIHQAYALDRHAGSAGYFGALFARGMFVALTTQRLLLFPSKHRFRGIVLQSNGVEAIELHHVRSVAFDGRALILNLTDGEEHLLVVPLDERTASNQRDFLRGLVKFGGSLPAV